MVNNVNIDTALKVLETFGFPVVILMSLGWFFVKIYWPRKVQQEDRQAAEIAAEKEKWKTERVEDRKEFLEALEDRGRRNDEERIRAEAERKRVVEEFLGAMSKRDQVHADVINKVSESIAANTEITKKMAEAMDKNTATLLEVQEIVREIVDDSLSPEEYSKTTSLERRKQERRKQ